MKPTLGVCYYPEHWPEEDWASDAERMVAAGLKWVRIGEFAWSRLEPKPGQYDFDWLARAIDVLGNAGLSVILGTPTATPPRWMLEKLPDMLGVDDAARVRKFGSRRHYCFSHLGYRAECAKMAAELGKRYGKNAHVLAWQIDNEYACHDTTLSYSDAALKGFREWLQQKYQSIDALNRAWGNVFWSMEYDNFDQVELPNLTVTEPNPSHVIDFKRYSSAQVVAFNKVQADVLRGFTDRPLIHNYMGRELSFDHFELGEDLDIASWDSYPIGFLSDRLEASDTDKSLYLRQGDPDNQAFHHDLYRAVGRGRWWVMEQQPGPVNWAPWNPAPLPGMARLWAWEAFAHGAETVCYFRWRQAPFAQELHHAGLLRPDSEDAPALSEARQVADEIEEFGALQINQAPVALIFDYSADWIIGTQPQGADFSYFRLVLDSYRALRRAGLTIDIVPPSASLDGYQLVCAPGVAEMSSELKQRLSDHDGIILVGPRAASKTPNGAIPVPLPPDLPNLDATVTRVESLPPKSQVPLTGGGAFVHWFEHVDTREVNLIVTQDDMPALVSNGRLMYLCGWPDHEAYDRVVETACAAAGIATTKMPTGLRIRETAQHRFVFNYAPTAISWNGKPIQPGDLVWESI